MKPVNGKVASPSAVNHVMATMVTVTFFVMTTLIGLTMEKYFSMLIEVSVNNDEASNRMFTNPFRWHILSPNIQSRVKHVMIENGIQNKATPRSAHAWFKMNMFVHVRSLRVRHIVMIRVMLPDMASSIMSPRTGASTKYSVSGSSYTSPFEIEEFCSWLKFKSAMVAKPAIEEKQF